MSVTAMLQQPWSARCAITIIASSDRVVASPLTISSPTVSNGAGPTTVSSEITNQPKESPMRRSLTWCFLGLVLLASAASSQAQETPGAERTVAALEQKWLQAVKANNPDLLAPLLADTLVNTDIDGKVTDKAAVLAEAKAAKYDSAALDNLKVTVFGDTAVATAGLKIKGTDASGKHWNANLRYTDTWVKMPNGQWQCVASQSTLVKM
jgi:ketosteroid isomerase-like protein